MTSWRYHPAWNNYGSKVHTQARSVFICVPEFDFFHLHLDGAFWAPFSSGSLLRFQLLVEPGEPYVANDAVQLLKGEEAVVWETMVIESIRID